MFCMLCHPFLVRASTQGQIAAWCLVHAGVLQYHSHQPCWLERRSSSGQAISCSQLLAMSSQSMQRPGEPHSTALCLARSSLLLAHMQSTFWACRCSLIYCCSSPMIESYMLEMGQMTTAHLSNWVLQMSFLRVKHILMADSLVCISACKQSL